MEQIELIHPSIIRPLNEIPEELIPELNLCIDTFINVTKELKNYFVQNIDIKSSNYMFIVMPKDDCLIKMTNEINKRGLDPVREWFNFFQLQSINNLFIKKIEHHNGIYLSNHICILEKKLKNEKYETYNGTKYKITSIMLDTHHGTGFEKELFDYVKVKFNDNSFKKMELKNIIINCIICTYYFDHESEENEKYLYASYQLPFYDYNNGKGRFIYYLTTNGDHNMINECVLCSKFGQINYII